MSDIEVKNEIAKREDQSEIEKVVDKIEKISIDGKRKLKVEEKKQNNTLQQELYIEIPFCCTTTLPKVFKVLKDNVFISFNSCLHCKTIQDTVMATCGNGVPCGYVDACITKVVGCIQYVAAADITTGSVFESAICCQGCVCVDECVKCEAGCLDAEPCPCGCSTEDPIVPVLLKPGSLKVCVKECKPCSNVGGNINTNTVTFSGAFLISRDFCNQDS